MISIRDFLQKYKKNPYRIFTIEFPFIIFCIVCLKTMAKHFTHHIIVCVLKLMFCSNVFQEKKNSVKSCNCNGYTHKLITLQSTIIYKNTIVATPMRGL